MPKTARGALFVIRNGRHSDVGPPRPPDAYGSNFVDLPRLLHEHLRVLRVCQPAHISRRDHRVWSWEACRADHGLCHHTDGAPIRRGLMATRLRRSDRISWVPLAAGSSARSPGPLAEQEAANDRHVHGCGDRQKLTILLSTSTLEPPLTTSSATTLSAHHTRHDSESTGCMEC